MMDAFGAYARYYDLLYRDKDYAAEAAYVHGLIQQHAPGAKTILDLGCGTGAHAAHFAGLGYTVLGVDGSEAMLERAGERQAQLNSEVAARLKFSSGDVRSFRAGRSFDVVTALFHVISYQVSNEDLTRAFATAADHLAPGGIFLFDCWYGPAVLRDPPVVRIKRLEDDFTRVLRIAEPTMHFNENLTQVDYQVLVTDLASGSVEEIREHHWMRYLFGPEIECALQRAGLVCKMGEEWGSGEPLSAATWSVLFIVRRSAKSESE